MNIYYSPKINPYKIIANAPWLLVVIGYIVYCIYYKIYAYLILFIVMWIVLFICDLWSGYFILKSYQYDIEREKKEMEEFINTP